MDDVDEFESSFLECSCVRLVDGGSFICNFGLFYDGLFGCNEIGGLAVGAIFAGIGGSTSIGSSSCSSGIGDVANASCCLKRSVVLRAMDVFFNTEDAFLAV